MRTIVTIGGILVSIALILLIHGAITTDNVRQIETEYAVDAVMDHAKQITRSGELSKIVNSNFTTYLCKDDSLISMPYQNYGLCIVGQIQNAGVTYAQGICCDPMAITVSSSDSIAVNCVLSSDALLFQVPIDQLKDVNVLSDVAIESKLVAGTDTLQFDSIIYTNRNIYTSDNKLVAYKNLLSEGDYYLAKNLFAGILERTSTDSQITMNVMDIDAEAGVADICLIEDYKYQIGRKGQTSKREAFCFQ